MLKDGKWARKIIDLQREDGSWDLGSTANDKIYLPLSDDWRKASTRIADCTHQITALLQNLEC